MADQLGAGDQAKLLCLLDEGDGVTANLGDPDRIDLGFLQLRDVGRKILGAHGRIQREFDFLALALDRLGEGLGRVAAPDVVGRQRGVGLVLEGLGPLANHRDVHGIRMVGAEAARLAVVAGQLVRFARDDEIGRVPAVQVLRQRQRDRRRNRAYQQVVAVARHLLGDAAAGVRRALVIADFDFHLAAINAALGVRLVNRELHGAHHLFTLLGEHAGLGTHQPDPHRVLGLRLGQRGQHGGQRHRQQGRVQRFHRDLHLVSWFNSSGCGPAPG